MTRTVTSILFVLFFALGGCGTPDGSENPDGANPEIAPEPAKAGPEDPAARTDRRREEQAESLLRSRIKASQCDEFLKELTKEPHMAGSKRNAQLAEYLVNTLTRFGYQVERHKYEVLLPYPLNVQVEMVAPQAFSASLREEPIELDLDTRASSVMPYNAFTPDCDLSAPLVYANYARREDFEELKALGVSVQGKIVLARYGHIFRGAKVRLASEMGAVGLLLYSDPADDGFVKGDPYPHGRFRPATGVERGSILDVTRYPGDPGTPGTPSLPGADQLTFDQMASLPNLPTTCLSQADARPFLEQMKGHTVPKGWQGGIPITYHVGNKNTVRVRMQLEMDYSLRQIENITASLTGLRCPEEVVLIGNHRDAWVHGAVDPGSGTAVLLEAARVIADANAAGQGLDRTVRFAFWDAEEFGMIGSTEYGEQFATELTKECVAYINVDAAVSGPDVRVAGVPSLEGFAREIFSSIRDESGTSWLIDQMQNPQGGFSYGTLGSGSDYTVFLNHLGIDCIDITSSGVNGVYHSGYDTYVFMKRYGDPGFKRHKQMAGVLATMITRLGRARILPLDFERAARILATTRTRMEAERSNLDLSEIGELADKMKTIGAGINEQLTRLSGRQISLESRLEINRRMYQAGRKLLLEGGLPTRPWYRHALAAPHPDRGYAAEDLPSIQDALLNQDKAAAQDGATKLVATLYRYLNHLEQLRLYLERIKS